MTHSLRVPGQSQAEKNLAWEAAQTQNQQMAQFKALAGLAPGTGPVQVSIRNVHPAIGVRLHTVLILYLAPHAPLQSLFITAELW